MNDIALSRRPLSKPASPMIPALDGFRAIAIIIVMLSHVGLSEVVPGQFGVTLFFFLSGYLITTLLRREFIRHGTISLRSFYFRRVVRILPPMYFAILLAAAFSFAGLIYPMNFQGLGADFFFLTNYLPISDTPIGLWSLAVEEHFYFLFPAIAYFCFRYRSAAACALVCVFICIATLGVRYVEVGRLDDFARVNFWTHTRIDSILFGAILASWNNPVIDEGDWLPGKWWSYALGGALLFLTFAIRDEVFRQTLRYSMQGIALLLIFNAAIRDRSFARTILDTKPLKWIGILSYSLYLVHSILIIATERLLPDLDQRLSAVIAIALSFVLAWLMHIWMERPLAEWRKKVERRKQERDDREMSSREDYLEDSQAQPSRT